MRSLTDADHRLAADVARSMASRLPRMVRDDAQSIAALALVELAAEYDTARGVPWRPWAWKSIQRRLINEARAERPRTHRVGRHDLPRRTAPDPAWIVSIRDEVAVTLGRLDPVPAKLLRLVYMDGHEHAEAARLCGVTRSTASTYLCHARQRLRRVAP